MGGHARSQGADRKRLQMKKYILLLSIIISISLTFVTAQAATILLVENDNINAEQLNIMVLTESGRNKLTDNGINPVFSPDKKKIAFLTFRKNGEQLDLAVMNQDGSGRTVLTNASAESFYITHPTWFPDGKRIAYIVNAGTVRNVKKSKLNVIDLSDNKVSLLLSKDGVKISDLAISSKGDKIAYVLDYGAAREIFILDLYNKATLAIKSGGIRDVSPMWSRDDENILFYSTKSLELLLKDSNTAAYNILAADTKTGEIEIVMPNIYGISNYPDFPFLSPDGKRIMYFADQTDMQGRKLTLKELGTKRTVKLTLDHLLMFGNIVWSGDGKHLLYISAEESQGLFVKQVSIDHPKATQSYRYEVNPQIFPMKMFMPIKFIDW